MKRIKKEGYESVSAFIPKDLKNELDLYSIAIGLFQKDIIVIALREYLKDKKDVVKQIIDLQKNI